MIENRILKIWSEGGVVINGWLHNPSTYSAELMAGLGYDSLTVDLQHGMIDFMTAFHMLQAMSSKPVTPLVRVPSHDPTLMMKLLDAGAFGIICPFVNNRRECESFVSACRYPPRGIRSNGAHRAILYAGADYMKYADSSIVTLAMIETREGVANVEEILSVEGLSGVYIGPTDLAYSMGRPPELDVADEEVNRAVDAVAAAARRLGKHAGIVSSGGEAAGKMILRGFDFVTPGTETGILKAAAAAEILRARASLR